MAFAALTIDLNARLAKFEQDLSRAGSSMDGLNRRAASLASGFKAAFGVASIAGIAAFAKSGIDAADALNDMSKRLGVSVKDLASFKLAAEQSGTSLDNIGTGIARLTRSIGEAEGGNKKLAKALGDLGITARDPKEAFFQLADAVQRIQDPARRAALLSQVLGKSYQELVPLLNDGGDALRESAKASESFANSMAKLAPDADKFNDQLAAMKQNAAGLASSLLVELVPALNEVLSRIGLVQNLIANGGLFNTLQITAGTSEMSEVMRRVKRDIEEVQGAIDRGKASGKNTSGFEERLRGLNAQLVILKQYSREAALALGKGFENYKVPQKPGGPGKINAPSGSSSSKSKSDPLASLLAGTDIGRLKEFDKQVALLNSRFNYGKKDADLYAQAMTKLVESTFSSNFSDFNKQLAEQSETQRAVADHLQATNDALFEQQQAWTEAGQSLENDMRTPLENANIEFGRLDELLERGVITWETYTRAVFKTQEAIASVPEKLKEMDTFAKTAAENIQNSFADFLFDPFENGLQGMAQSFGNMIKKMIADAVAADLARRLFGGLAGGSGEGMAGSLLTGFGKLLGFANGGVSTPFGALPGYASGGITSGPTSGYPVMMHGTEAILPLKRGANGKLGVQGGGGHTINVYVTGTNAQDVRRAAGQGAREALGMFGGAQRYA